MDRWHRIQMVGKGGCQSTCIAGQPHSRWFSGTQRPCRDAGVGAIAPGFAMLTRASALYTLIRQRHLTPSCGGHVPTAERTLNPARMFVESLTPRPELENSQGQPRRFCPLRHTSASLPLASVKADIGRWDQRQGARAERRRAGDDDDAAQVSGVTIASACRASNKAELADSLP